MARTATQKTTENLPAVANPEFDIEQLADIKMFDDAIALYSGATGEPAILAHEELGDGFALLDGDNRDRLIGVPMFLLEWTERPADYGDTYVSVRVVARNDNGSATKYIVNFGGSGVYEQLRDFTQRSGGKSGGLLVKHGLRRSDFYYSEETKSVCSADASGAKPARAYYLDLSA